MQASDKNQNYRSMSMLRPGRGDNGDSIASSRAGSNAGDISRNQLDSQLMLPLLDKRQKSMAGTEGSLKRFNMSPPQRGGLKALHNLPAGKYFEMKDE